MSIKTFEEFLTENIHRREHESRIFNDNGMTDEELENQTVPNYIVKEPTDFRKINGDGGFDLNKFDIVYIDEEGDRLVVIDGNNPGMILDFFPGFSITHFIEINSPEGKEFFKQHRGLLSGRDFGF